MTTTIVLGEKKLVENKTPIKFLYYLDRCANPLPNGDLFVIKDISTMSSVIHPKYFRYIELVCKNYNKHLDLMFCYDNPEQRSDNCLMILGKWNDGVIE